MLFATTLGLHYLHYELFEKEGLNVNLNSMIQFHKRLFLPKKREFFNANNCRKCHSTEKFRRWIKVGDYKGRKIEVVKDG